MSVYRWCWAAVHAVELSQLSNARSGRNQALWVSDVKRLFDRLKMHASDRRQIHLVSTCAACVWIDTIDIAYSRKRLFITPDNGLVLLIAIQGMDHKLTSMSICLNRNAIDECPCENRMRMRACQEQNLANRLVTLT
ncbi:hypothetical protein F5146DRAFT_1000725 [Armillaria mellea]|nr:hypothetical protein F5146DRAFT_1000725 [Armillaria mellea]